MDSITEVTDCVSNGLEMNETTSDILDNSFTEEVIVVVDDKGGVLSNVDILHHWKNGDIIISPFIEKNVSSASVDVTLGEFYYRQKPPSSARTVKIDGKSEYIYNIYSENDIKNIWKGPFIAEKLGGGTGDFDNIDPEDLVIWIHPGETILTHTQEFIGSKDKIVTMMKCRSSLGRSNIGVCKCSGWSDCGFTNKYCMEITNFSQYYAIPLVVGRRIAQIIFLSMKTPATISYANTGKYQNTDDQNQLETNWKPDMMLPRLYEDRDIKKSIIKPKVSKSPKTSKSSTKKKHHKN